MAAAPSAPFSAVIFLTLLAVLGLSAGVFWALLRRETSRRQWVALSEWARDCQFRFVPDALLRLPPPFDALPKPALGHQEPRVRLCLSDGPTTLVQMQTGPGAAEAAIHAQLIGLAEPHASSERGAAAPIVASEVQWNLLIRNLRANWPPTGLRPTGAAVSVIDLFTLTGYPRLGSIDRFVVFGTASEQAATLSDSFSRALLPPDVGLLLHGPWLILDFSSRHFDVIEFNRMLALAEQIVVHLPASI